MDKNIKNYTINILRMTKKTDSTSDNPLSKKKEGKNLEKYEILSKVADLEILAKKAMMIGDYEEAIGKSEEIIRLSILGDLSQYFKDQQAFLNEIAYKVHQEYTTKEINDVGNGIRRIYETLIDAEKVQEAHYILNDFKEKYSDISFFNNIPLIQELIDMDTKLWMKYQLSLEKREKHLEGDELYNLEDDIDEIKKFLKKI